MSTIDITLRTLTSAFRNNFNTTQNLSNLSSNGVRRFGNTTDGLIRNRASHSIENRSAALDKALTKAEDAKTALNLAVTKGEEALDLLYEAEDLYLLGAAETDLTKQTEYFERADNLVQHSNAKLDSATYKGKNYLKQTTSSKLNDIGIQLGSLELAGTGTEKANIIDEASPTVTLTENDWLDGTAAGVTTIATANSNVENASYSLVNDHGGLFSIDATTGVITANIYDPSNIANPVLDFDFSDAANYSTGATFTAFDLAGSANNAVQGTANEQPLIDPANTLNGLQTAHFDGLAADDGKATDVLHIANEASINGANTTNKVINFTFNAENVSTRQIIYEEGGGSHGIVAQIEGGNLYVGLYESAGGSVYSYGRYAINANETYSVTFQYDGTTTSTAGDYTQLTVNGDAATIVEGGNSGDLNIHSAHGGAVGLGGSRDGVRAVNTGNGTMNRNITGADNTGFQGQIGEFNYYTGTIDATEAAGVNNYHRLKWQDFELEVAVTDVDTGATSATTASVHTSGGSAETVNATLSDLNDVETYVANIPDYIDALEADLEVLRAQDTQISERYDTIYEKINIDASTYDNISSLNAERVGEDLQLAEIRHSLALNSLSLIADTASGGQTILQAYLKGTSSSSSNIFNFNDNNAFG